MVRYNLRNGIKGRIQSGGFLRILTVAFLLFLDPTGPIFNPAGLYLSLTQPNLSSVYVKIRRNLQILILSLTQDLHDEEAHAIAHMYSTIINI